MMPPEVARHVLLLFLTMFLALLVNSIPHKTQHRQMAPEYGAQNYLADAAHDPMMWAWTPKGADRLQPLSEEKCYSDKYCGQLLWSALNEEIGPLTTSAGRSTYRAANLYACHGAAAVQLEQNAVGLGRLSAYWRTKNGLQRRTWVLPLKQTNALVRTIKVQQLDRLLSDPARVPKPMPRYTCYDGSNWVFEEDGPRGYRYVARDCGVSNYDQVDAAALALFRAFYNREPGVWRQIVCSS